MPRDFECSLEELDYVVARARRYRGPKEERRHVAVAKYDLRDPLLPDFVETSSHVTIYEQALDGKQRVYRQFLKAHDGTITEIFGSADAAAVFGTARPVDKSRDGTEDAPAKRAGADDEAALSALGGYFSGLKAI